MLAQTVVNTWKKACEGYQLTILIPHNFTPFLCSLIHLKSAAAGLRWWWWCWQQWQPSPSNLRDTTVSAYSHNHGRPSPVWEPLCWLEPKNFNGNWHHLWVQSKTSQTNKQNKPKNLNRCLKTWIDASSKCPTCNKITLAMFKEDLWIDLDSVIVGTSFKLDLILKFTFVQKTIYISSS